jgi:hypothetical protein
MNKNQSGFSLFLIFLMLIVLILVCVIGYNVYSNNNNKKKYYVHNREQVTTDLYNSNKVNLDNLVDSLDYKENKVIGSSKVDSCYIEATEQAGFDTGSQPVCSYRRKIVVSSQDSLIKLEPFANQLASKAGFMTAKDQASNFYLTPLDNCKSIHSEWNNGIKGLEADMTLLDMSKPFYDHDCFLKPQVNNYYKVPSSKETFTQKDTFDEINAQNTAQQFKSNSIIVITFTLTKGLYNN